MRISAVVAVALWLGLGGGAARAASGPAVSPESFSRFFGNYRRADGTLVSIGRDEDSVFFMDYATRRRWRLEPRPDGSLSIPGGTAPAAIAFESGDDGRGPVPVWKDGDGSEHKPLRLPLRTEDVAFQSGKAKLSGTLWLPPGDGPHPAVVLVHDAGAQLRYALGVYPSFLVSRGFAVLAYDKRGTGRSTGDWKPWSAGIRVLEGDALAGVALLRARKDIRADRVGLLGVSGGAWVAVSAAAHSPDVAFIVPVTGGGGSLWEQELYRLHNDGLRHGLTAPELAELHAFMRQVYDARLYAPAREKASLAQLAAMLARAKGTRWFALTPVAPFKALPASSLLPVGRQVWERELSYDATADLRRVRCPVLALLGEEDEVVPTKAVAAALKANLKKAGNREATIAVLPGVGHALTEPADPLKPAARTLAKGLFEMLGAWLDARALAAAPAKP